MSRAIVAAMLLLAPLAAPAAAVCRLVSGSTLAFGSYDLLASAPRDSQMSVTITCEGAGAAQTVAISLGVDQGANGSTVNTRRMVHADGTGDALAYAIYRDSARSSIWGVSQGVDTMGATLAVPGAGSVSAQFILYGRIAPRQNARVGSYRDAVQMTINY